MNISESIILALESVKANKLRAGLTLLSIAIGVFAIIGAGTLTSSINNAVTGEMSELGENTYLIQKMPLLHTHETWRKYMHRKSINYNNYREFKKLTAGNGIPSTFAYSQGYQIKSGNQSTDPDVLLMGTDENYFYTNNVSLSEGRPFMQEDILMNRNVAIVGNDVIVKLFAQGGSAIGKRINIKNQSFEIIGVLSEKGAVLGQSQDNRVLIPITLLLKYYASEWEESLTITVRAASRLDLPVSMDESIGAMRTIRNLKPWDENDFEVITNDSIKEMFNTFTDFLAYFGIASGLIALFAAGVGIANIMLVSIKERTREIGVRKAVGARKFWILTQFIVEAITLCQIGGIAGIFVGLLGAWLLSFAIHISLVFPTGWIIFSLLTCTILGVVSGVYPAWKAANLDPIEALRYE